MLDRVVERTCTDCKFAIFQDTGYSTYTVEGTDFYCAKRLHPKDGFDRFYGHDDRLDFAAECAGFEHGEPVRRDVDHDDYDWSELTQEQRDIWTWWAADPSAAVWP